MHLRHVTQLLVAATAVTAIAAGGTAAWAGDQTVATATLNGAQEVPGPGDSDGVGSLTVSTDAAGDQLCIDLKVTGIATPTAAHIHQGAVGESGAPVVELPVPEHGKAKACVNADANVIASIVSDPAGYYVNVHNAEFPKGAIRGQLVGK